jgi:FdhD protein
MSTSRLVPVRNWRSDQVAGGAVEDRIAIEAPVALTYNRVSHVVMMATPADLEDLGLGFSLTEGLIGSPADLLGTRIIPRPGGLELAMTIAGDWFDRLSTRRRNMAGRTGCGLCGAENIEQALRHPAPVGRSLEVTHAALQRAVAALDRHQPLQADTGAAHGAAWCTPDGQVQQLREDVGRHNALDKLIGGLLRGGVEPSAGFVLVSSRASYEMVYKAAAAGVELLVAVSAPTTLAVEFAQGCGVTLVGFARPGRQNVYTFEERIADWRAKDAGRPAPREDGQPDR